MVAATNRTLTYRQRASRYTAGYAAGCPSLSASRLEYPCIARTCDRTAKRRAPASGATTINSPSSVAPRRCNRPGVGSSLRTFTSLIAAPSRCCVPAACAARYVVAPDQSARSGTTKPAVIVGINRHRAATTGALLESILREPVQFIFGHRRSDRPLMTFLAALFAFASGFSRPDGLHDVRRRWLGAVRRVFCRGSQLGGHFVKLRRCLIKLGRCFI